LTFKWPWKWPLMSNPRSLLDSPLCSLQLLSESFSFKRWSWKVMRVELLKWDTLYILMLAKRLQIWYWSCYYWLNWQIGVKIRAEPCHRIWRRLSAETKQELRARNLTADWRQKWNRAYMRDLMINWQQSAFAEIVSSFTAM